MRNCSHKTNKFIERAKRIHGDYYDYSLSEYERSTDKLVIICPKHGRFDQSPHSHLRGSGCRKCGYEKTSLTKKTNLDDVIGGFRETHGEKYDYSKFRYAGSGVKGVIVCPTHGEFEQTPSLHKSGQGCPRCANTGVSKRSRTPFRDFLTTSNGAHNNRYDYLESTYRGVTKPVGIICPTHGVFNQQALYHMRGGGCPQCSYEKRGLGRRISDSEVVERMEQVHGNAYSYHGFVYNGMQIASEMHCPVHGKFLQRPDNHLNGAGCPKCSSSNHSSKHEDEISEYIESLGISIVRHQRDIIGRKELDIVIPSHNIAIEYCGVFWHREGAGKSRRYHLDKTIQCESHGLRLITIFEDEWVLKKDLVKSRLRHLLGKTPSVIGARKCTVGPITSKTAVEFLNKYHIQGAGSVNPIRYGAYYGENLVGVMTFCRTRRALGNSSNQYELVRMATDMLGSYPGLASKLFREFIRDYPNETVISYADRRWNTGSVYEKLGFKFESATPPSYWYTNGQKNRIHRYTMRKSILIERGGDPNLTEYQNALNMGYDRIWDCGCFRYKYYPA